MGEFQAAILVAQLERLPELTRRREAMAERLDTGLESIAGIELLRRDERQTTVALAQCALSCCREGRVSRISLVAAQYIAG
jgi:dTDP-4-amino-4,6-dideoxygalactose transaminase